MKKEYTITIFSVLIIIVAAALLINKSSYAGVVIRPNICPEQIKVNVSKENLSLIKTNYTTISLPKSINVKNSEESYLDKDTIQLMRNKNIYQLDEKDLFSQGFSGSSSVASIGFLFIIFPNDLYPHTQYGKSFGHVHFPCASI